MRISLSALLALGIGTSGALAGGGTVTSTEPGPQTLSVKTTGQMLDTMSIDTGSTAEPVEIKHVSPPPAPPAKKEAKADEPKETKVAAAAGPLIPRDVARQCATCHGYDGIARIPTAPNIAGSSRQYLETQLKAFRSGKRENEVMAVIAEELSNAEIKAVAKWYAGLKVSVEGAE